jgi:hypothetical protein
VWAVWRQEVRQLVPFASANAASLQQMHAGVLVPGTVLTMPLSGVAHVWIPSTSNNNGAHRKPIVAMLPG